MYHEEAVSRQPSAVSRDVIDRVVLVVSTLFAACLMPAHVVAQPVIVDLGIISGGDSSEGSAVSDDGSAVCGSVIFDIADSRAFRWTSGAGIVNLVFLSGGNSAYSFDISANGAVIVGGSNSSTSNFAYRWTSGTGMVSLGVLSGDDSSNALGVSSDGLVVVGGSSNGSNSRAFRWTSAGGMQSLGTLSGGSTSGANAANHDGTFIVGQATNSTTTVPTSWTSASGLVGISLLTGVDALSGNAADVSRYTEVVVGSNFCQPPIGDPYSRAFRWTAGGGVEDLGFLSGGTTAIATAISGNGGGIIGSANNLETRRAMGGEAPQYVAALRPVKPNGMFALFQVQPTNEPMSYEALERTLGVQVKMSELEAKAKAKASSMIADLSVGEARLDRERARFVMRIEVTDPRGISFAGSRLGT
jgi:probable HAF family extracellular repeat protein